VCLSKFEGEESAGSGTVAEGIVSNLMVILVAEASAAFWSNSLRTVHSPEYLASTLSIRARVLTVTASSSAPERSVRARRASKSMFTRSECYGRLRGNRKDQENTEDQDTVDDGVGRCRSGRNMYG
jgi:hypothetical protein